MTERTHLNPLRIRLALPDSPLPFGGAAGRWCDILLRGLVARGHEVVAFAVASPHEQETIRDLFPSEQFHLRLSHAGRGACARVRRRFVLIALEGYL